ncbi:hypothetical protein ANN_12654 [Periplaneta americana]|uniref:Uncharacterized protein n=1 Tax=Periplaneta americana TaxID=6978 RepID=A0ABQ8TJC1_PERAM|nr:hypothetical protein ANN_12654 [Periplaneta americana]
MMPLAPTPIVAVPSKPKIGFSIDSIVGGGTNANGAACTINTNSPTSTATTTTPTTTPKHRPATSQSPECDVINTDTSPNPPSASPASSTASNHYVNNIENNRTTSHSPAGSSSPELSPGTYHRARHHSGSLSPSISPTSSPPLQGNGLPPTSGSVGISSAPTLVRPSALAPSTAGIVGSPGFNPSSGSAGDAGLKGLYLPEPLVHPGHHHHSHHHPHHHHQLALAAAAAAQHFQAAGLAAALAQQTGHHGAAGFGAPPGAGAPTHLAPHHPTPHPAAAAAAIPRDTYPLYPWLLSRHGRIFPHRFPAVSIRAKVEHRLPTSRPHASAEVNDHPTSTVATCGQHD